MQRFKECLDCSHSKHAKEGNYCYMFKDVPTTLPCGQHDKYKELRKATGKLILKHPLILYAIIQEAIMDTEPKSYEGNMDE